MGEVIIRFSQVKKRFGAKIVFSDLSLELRRGETTAILGASGSGKSVLLKMLIGLIPKDSGTIEFDGQDISNIDDAKYGEVRRRIAYVFQGPPFSTRCRSARTSRTASESNFPGRR